ARGARPTERKVKSRDNKHLCIRRVVSYTELWRHRDKSIARGSNIDTRSNKEFVCGITPRATFACAFKENFDADVQGLINQRIGQRAAHLEYTFARTAVFVFICQVSGPIPAMGKCLTKQQLELPDVGRVIIKAPLAVKRRVQWNLSPVSKCVTKLDA